MQENKIKTAVMIGCFDTKAEDFHYLYNALERQGLNTLTINTGVMGSTDLFPVDYDAEVVATKGGQSLESLRDQKDRGKAIDIMAKGASQILTELHNNQQLDGVIGMGGGGGTYIFLSAVHRVPFGIPKICVSTIATKDVSDYVLNKDITLVPSIVDVAGLNTISRVVINQTAGALSGMIQAGLPDDQTSKGTIAISIFGNTTPCVDACSEILKAKGYEVMTFHAVGSGGRTMEALIEEDVFDGVLDITTTELADHLCGGICSAGPDRLTAAVKKNIPQVVAPGCLDMVNFGALDTVPDKYQSRLLYSWAPDVTLLRTNEKENKILGQMLVEKLNASQRKVTLFLPKKGISIVSAEGGIFYKPEIDQVLFDTIKTHAADHVEVIEVDAHINDQEFAEKLVDELLELM